MAANVTNLVGEAAISTFRTTRQVGTMILSFKQRGKKGSVLTNVTDLIIQIYRDLMRVTRHAGRYNSNEAQLQQRIRSQFKANMTETNEKKIQQMRAEYVSANPR